jgi:ATP phosphoribosyltransferase
MIAESGHEPLIEQILPLGFGKCALQVQVPVSGHIQSVEALSGARVATSFEVLGGRYFKEVDERVQGSSEGQGRANTTIEYVGGSVEAACALGMADGIVDLVGELPSSSSCRNGRSLARSSTDRHHHSHLL